MSTGAQESAVLVFNAGSATLKCALFDGPQAQRRVLQGLVSGFGAQAKIQFRHSGASQERTAALANHAEAAAACLSLIESLHPSPPAGPGLYAVAHRVVHGGSELPPCVRLDANILAQLRALTPLAPLHQPPALAVIDAVGQRLGPGTPSFAVFDTGFFHALPEAARTYALPAQLRDRFKLRRYGFHGLAHRSLFEGYCVLGGCDPQATRAITLQLGHGCSAAAICDGEPLDTSMGFTPLAGLVMGTRPGDLDPGLLIHVLRQGIALEDLDELLQHRSGLLGLSGDSSDMRRLLELEAGGRREARLAVEVFCHSVHRHVGAFLGVLGGADAIVIGGGIGENAPDIRRRCLEGFEWAGLRLDAELNRAGGPRISSADSRLAAWVIPTDEERVMAGDTLEQLHGASRMH